MYFNYKLFDGYAVNAADGYSFNTPWTDVKQAQSYSISCMFTGTPSGTLSLQTSNESDLASPYGNIIGTQSAAGVNALNSQPQNNGLDANTYPNSTFTISSAGTTTYDVPLPGHRWVRLVYTATSGTAVATIWVDVKG
jgi:hypothetical protein